MLRLWLRLRLWRLLRLRLGLRLWLRPGRLARLRGGGGRRSGGRTQRREFLLGADEECAHGQPVAVEVYRYHITEVEGSAARFEIECAAGTYIRSLAHELGLRVGCGAHLEEICRTASGEFTLDQAIALERLEALVKEDQLPQVLIPMCELLPDLPQAVINAGLERKIRNGGRIEVSESQIQPARLEQPIDSDAWKPLRLRVLNQQRQLVAIAQAIVPRVFQPIVVLPVPA